MKIKINDILLDFILILLFLFPIIIKFRDFYMVSIVSIIFIISIFVKYISKIPKIKNLIAVSLLIIVYSINIIILTTCIDNTYFLYSINKIINMLMFIAIIIYLINTEKTKKISNFIMYSIILTALMFIGLYFMGIEGINLTLTPKIIDTKYNMLYFGEQRMSGFFEHKIQFSATCLIGIFLIEDSEINVVKKIIYESILMMSIFMSNSKMALPLGFIIIFLGICKKWQEKLKSIKNYQELFIVYAKMIAIGLCLIALIMISSKIYDDLLKTRDVSTLGQRTIIWELAINDISQNPIGILKTYGKNLNNGMSIYSTAHNQILNEFLETGIIGGILILMIMILSLIMIKGIYYKLIFLIFTLLAQFDFLITGLFGYVFWIFVALLIVNSQKNIIEVTNIERK